MRKQSYFTNSHGFILPSITLVILITLIVFTTNIMIYQQEIVMAKNHLEQLKIESLIQLGIESYKDDLKNSNHFLNEQHYYFPLGDVSIEATADPQQDQIIIDFLIITDRNQKYIGSIILQDTIEQ